MSVKKNVDFVLLILLKYLCKQWPQMQLEIGEQGAGGCHHADGVGGGGGIGQ